MTREERLESSVARDFIRHKVRRMVRGGGIPKSEAADLTQRLVLALWEALARFNPAAGPVEPYINGVLLRAVASTLRQRKRRSRAEHATKRVYRRRMNEAFEASGDPSRSDRSLDVATVMARLSPELRDLAHRLSHSTVADVARDLDVPRSTLQRRIHKLRSAFEDANLDEYL